MFLIVIATSDPKQLYIQILLKPDVYSPFLKHVVEELATIFGYIEKKRIIKDEINVFIIYINTSTLIKSISRVNK